MIIYTVHKHKRAHTQSYMHTLYEMIFEKERVRENVTLETCTVYV